MGVLQHRLDRIREEFEKAAPESAKAVLRGATEELRASGALDGIPRPGDTLPPFELPDASGRLVRARDLLERGPLVLSVYRGLW